MGLFWCEEYKFKIGLHVSLHPNHTSLRDITSVPSDLAAVGLAILVAMGRCDSHSST